MKRRVNRDPLRLVTSAVGRQCSSINNDQLQTQWWDCTLECGHETERPMRFPKQVWPSIRRGFAALHHPRRRSEALPAPKRVRCRSCRDVK